MDGRMEGCRYFVAVIMMSSKTNGFQWPITTVGLKKKRKGANVQFVAVGYYLWHDRQNGCVCVALMWPLPVE